MMRLLTLWDRLRSSLWLLPTLMALGGGALAAAAMAADLGLLRGDGLPWWLQGSGGDEARRLLAALLTAIITMATLAVSITMVVLTLAANQLGPRLIRTFMDDRRTQTALGALIATVVYLVVVLRSVGRGGDAAEVPQLAVAGGTLLSLGSVIVLLLFVHHLAREIVADTMIRRVGGDLDRAIRGRWPSGGAGEEDAAGRSDGQPAGSAAVIGLERSGYVQTIDVGALAAAAAARDVVIHIGFRPGDHLLAGGPHVLVVPASACAEPLGAAIRGAVEIGEERTPVQDLGFAVRQLVEIALRALSPGISDPFTAIAAIDRLAAALALVPPDAGPLESWRAEDGAVRVTMPRLGFSGLLAAAFDQIRQAAADRPDVLAALCDALGRLGERTPDEGQRRVLRKQVAMVAEAGRRLAAAGREEGGLADCARRALRRIAGTAEGDVWRAAGLRPIQERKGDGGGG